MTVKIPATIVTGFLGAGKTTLIRGLLAQARGRRIALVVNEFGDVGVDGDLLAGCGIEGCAEEDVIELANGCICCTVADDFIPVMTRILNRPEPVDHIVIETSGLALPQPLVRAFEWPEVADRVTVDGVVTVVDAAAVAEGRFADDEAAVLERRAADPSIEHESPIQELFEDQLVCADIVLLNKADLLDAAGLDRVRAVAARDVRPGVTVLACAQGEVPITAVLGLGLAAEKDMAQRRTHHEREGVKEHDHDDFVSFHVDLPQPAGVEELLGRVAEACAVPDILRIKGFVDLGRDMRYVVQAVGTRVQGYFDRDWREGEERLSRLVVIGARGFDEERVARALGA
ncbi:MAG: cobalamin biosynthesis protein CobW [Geminicoccaceae bacterium]|nr:cobalamin biosynthesis protein CobW [Geminicoccaceae bacterium]MCB2055771.1 cobalamin biosynthesis protein CobW [Geminicoccaceae bacterium]